MNDADKKKQAAGAPPWSCDPGPTGRPDEARPGASRTPWLAPSPTVTAVSLKTPDGGLPASPADPNRSTEIRPVSPVFGNGTPKELARLTKYDMLGELGRGGMGAVYKVREKALGRIVALKMILGAPTGQALERFLAEARLVSRLNHPGIVPIFEINAVDGVPYFTMAFIDGGSLASALKSGPPPPFRPAHPEPAATTRGGPQATRPGGPRRTRRPEGPGRLAG